MSGPQSSAITIRDARQTDLYAIAECIANAREDGLSYLYDEIDDPNFASSWVPRMLPIIRWYMCQSGALIQVAECEEKVVGSVIWTRFEDAGNGEARLAGLRSSSVWDSLNLLLMRFENDYRAFYDGLHPRRIVRHPVRGKALDVAREEAEKSITTSSFLELAGLHVNPRYQSRGIGKILLQWGLDKAAEMSLPIYVKAERRGLNFYAHLGFHILPTSEFWLDRNGEFVSRESVENGNVDWKQENGGVSGGAAMYSLSEPVLDAHRCND